MAGFLDKLLERTSGPELQEFTAKDAERRAGVGDPQAQGLADRNLEGRLIASILGPLAPVATLPAVGAAGLNEAVKAGGQATGLGKFFPGPFKQNESSSPASLDNVLSFARGFSERGTTEPLARNTDKAKDVLGLDF